MLIGTALAIGMSFTLNVSMPDAAGILCGATTNTPALGAAQQTLQQMGIDPNGAALSCAVTYPLGVIGVILAIVFIRKVFVRPSDMPEPDAEHRKNVFIASYHLTNPAVFGKSVHEIASQSHHHFVISRIWRNGRVSIPTSDKTLQTSSLVITAPSKPTAAAIFGEAGTERLERGKHRLERRGQPAGSPSAFWSRGPKSTAGNSPRCACATTTASISAASTVRACSYSQRPICGSRWATA